MDIKYPSNRAEEDRFGLNEKGRVFVKGLATHRDSARQAIAKAQDQQKRVYDKGRKEHEDIQEGSFVLINPHSLKLVESRGKGASLGPKWIGPFEVMKKINPNVFRLRMDDTYLGFPVFNVQHLRLYHPNTEEDWKARAFKSTARPKEPSEE